ncbi:hypothetical protein HDU67_002379 [Dinochytrium kinnereticum]|nr:hypothetical protein HDU67_002379 [Dinochytrium kinnereticum]
MLSWCRLAAAFTVATLSSSALGSSIALHLHPSTSSGAGSPSKEISWDQATSILSHINGVSKFLRGGLVLNDDSESNEVLSVLDDERVKRVSGNMFEQPEASLVVVVKGLEAEALPIPVSFRISTEDSTSGAMISEYMNDFTELVSDAHISGDMVLSISAEPQNPTIAGTSRVSLREKSALLSIPEDAPEYVQNTLGEIAATAYDSVKSHALEKFGDKAEVFDEKERVDRMFMIEVEFVSSLFEALRIQRIHRVKKQELSAKLPDFIGLTLSGANNVREKYGSESPQYKAAASISQEVLKKIVESFSVIYETGVVEMISVGPEIPAVGQLPNLVKRLATINAACPQAISDCETVFHNCSNHGACSKFPNPRNTNQTCFFCSCFTNNTDDSGTVLLGKNHRKVKWAGPFCAAQDISSDFNILLWTVVGLAITVIFVIGMMYSIGEAGPDGSASGVGKRRKED